MKTELKIGMRRGREQRAFSLLEVMIAIGIFFMAVFAILGLVSSSLENARRLQRPIVDASPVAGYLLQTNVLVEGVYEADLGDFLGNAYQRLSGDVCRSGSGNEQIFPGGFCRAKSRSVARRSSQK